MTIRGGGNPNTAMAAMPLGEWTRRLGALLQKRMTASWSGSFGSNRIQACGAIFLPHRQAPLGSSVEQYPIVIGSRRAHGRQGQASGGAERAPSLTAVARDGDRDLCRDERMLPPGVEPKNRELRKRRKEENVLRLKLG